VTDLQPVLCVYTAFTKDGTEYPGGKMIHVRRVGEIAQAFEAAMLADQRSRFGPMTSFWAWRMDAYLTKSGKARF
jgi:hypothetical protein